MNKWEIRGLSLSREISYWSKDPSTKVGALILDQNHRVVSFGYNGYPKGCCDDGMENRDIKLAKIIHAEQNAILFAKRDLTGCTMYVWPMAPCSRCAGIIIQSGITKIVTIEPSEDLYARWGKDIEIAFSMYQEREVKLIQFPKSLFFEKYTENNIESPVF